jgi:3-phosphoshikimate 1-carboxyvinyltransferase
MQEIKPHTKKISWQLPSSKSHLARALILACYYSKKIIHSGILAQDSLDLLHALKMLGVQVVQTETWLEIDASAICHKNFGKVKISIGEGATSLRFLSLLLVQLKGEFELEMGESLKARPHDELIQLLPQHISLKDQRLIIKSNGELNFLAKKIQIDCARSTQFASAVVLNFSKLNLQYEMLNLKGSGSYLDMTQQMLHDFQMPTPTWQCPSDWSSAAFAIAYGLLIGESHLHIAPDKSQADYAIMQILDLLQVEFRYEDHHLSLKPSKSFKSFAFDFEACPDLFPVACFIASFAEGESKLSGLERLKFKESDRLIEMQKMLKIFGVKWSMQDDALLIEGNPMRVVEPHEAKFADDHRIVMTQVLFSLKASGRSVIENSECVKKSFPNFMSQILTKD